MESNMRATKLFLGVLLVVGGVLVGIYAGIIWALLGGIFDLVSLHQAPPVLAAELAVTGVLKLVLALPIGYVTAIALICPGAKLLSE